MNDMVHNPKHYCDGRKIQPVDVWASLDILVTTCLGNSLKYIARAGRKDKITQEIDKSIEFIDLAMSERECITTTMSVCKDWDIKDRDLQEAVKMLRWAIVAHQDGMEDMSKTYMACAKQALQRYRAKLPVDFEDTCKKTVKWVESICTNDPNAFKYEPKANPPEGMHNVWGDIRKECIEEHKKDIKEHINKLKDLVSNDELLNWVNTELLKEERQKQWDKNHAKWLSRLWKHKFEEYNTINDLNKDRPLYPLTCMETKYNDSLWCGIDKKGKYWKVKEESGGWKYYYL